MTTTDEGTRLTISASTFMATLPIPIQSSLEYLSSTSTFNSSVSSVEETPPEKVKKEVMFIYRR